MPAQEKSLITSCTKQKITYQERGSGATTIIAVHGWLDNLNSFSPLAERLSEAFKFISLDLPGHGISDNYPAEKDYAMLEDVFTLREFSNEVCDSKFILLGHSMGASICSIFASVYPEKVEQGSLFT